MDALHPICARLQHLRPKDNLFYNTKKSVTNPSKGTKECINGQQLPPNENH